MPISNIRKLHELRRRLDLLPPLAALIETRSVTAAADQLNLSQPAMSRILSQLRMAFSDPLLVRTGGEMALTPRARDLQSPLMGLLAEASDLFRTQRFDPREERLTLRVVIPDVLAAYLAPKLLQAMAEESPGSRLEFLPWRSAAPSGRTPDLVITSNLGAYPSMRAVHLYDDHDVLARRSPPTDGEEALRLDHVAVVGAGANEDEVDRWLADHKRTRRVVTTVPTYLLALHLVATTSLCAILPYRFVRHAGVALGVLPFELPVPQEPDRICLLHPPADDADPASLWLRDLVSSICSPASLDAD